MNIKEIKKSYRAERRRLKKIFKKEKKLIKKEYKSKISSLKERYAEDIENSYSASQKKVPINPPKRAILEEIGNAITHGLGSVFAIVSFILMLIYADSANELISASVYFFGSFVMFTMSCLYHAFSYGLAVKRLFRRFDYSSIYLLIGSTFAPVLLYYIGGTFGFVFFLIQWLIISTGITLVGVFGPGRLKYIHNPLYILLGWSALILAPKLISSEPRLFFWILGGGITYSLGIIPFAIKTKVSHFIWHFFVLAGAVLQWIGIFIYVYLY